MAAQPEAKNTNAKNNKSAFTKALNDARTQIEKVFNDTFSQINVRVQEAEKDVREFLSKLETESKERFESTLESMPSGTKVKDLLDKLKAKDLVGQSTRLGEELVDQGLKIGEEAIEKLGLVRASELETLNAELAKLAKKIESIRRKANSAPTKKSVEELSKRLTKLEKASPKATTKKTSKPKAKAKAKK